MSPNRCAMGISAPPTTRAIARKAHTNAGDAMAIVVSVRPLLQHRSQRDPTVDCAPSTRPHGSARSGHCSLECMHNPASSVPRTALCSADPNLNRTHARTHARTHTLSTRASTCMPKPATSFVPPPPLPPPHRFAFRVRCRSRQQAKANPPSAHRSGLSGNPTCVSGEHTCEAGTRPGRAREGGTGEAGHQE